MLKQLILHTSRNSFEFYKRDFKEFPNSLFPGEWIQIKNQESYWLGYANPFAEPAVRVVEKLSSAVPHEVEEEFLAWQTIKKKLKQAIDLRHLLKGYEKGMRLVHGSGDNLPGLIVDIHLNCILVQINTAGIDRFRDLLHAFLQEGFDKEVFFLDLPSPREKEGLPIFDKSLPSVVEVEENGFSYQLRVKNLQKIGFYYDHRENRKKLEQKISELSLDLKKGLDIFCYGGSWGLHMLRANISKVVFVDQGDFENEIMLNISKNGFFGRGNFLRQDAFKFLDDCISRNEYFDAVVSDPPAFSKEYKNIKAALLGYEKLHRKVMQVLAPTSIFVAASCTHGVSLDELANTVSLAARKENRKIEILDVGVQAADHPFSSFESKEFYLKYLLYLVRSEI